MEKLSRNRDPSAIRRARRFRKTMTASERVVWEFVRDHKFGLKFRRQYPIGPYVLDFYCAAAKVALEVDGPFHDLRVDKDAERDRLLDEAGILTFRFRTDVIFEPKDKGFLSVMDELAEICLARSKRTE